MFKNFDWDRPITWRDYRDMCLFVFIVYTIVCIIGMGIYMIVTFFDDICEWFKNLASKFKKKTVKKEES